MASGRVITAIFPIAAAAGSFKVTSFTLTSNICNDKAQTYCHTSALMCVTSGCVYWSVIGRASYHRMQTSNRKQPVQPADAVWCLHTAVAQPKAAIVGHGAIHLM